MATAEKTVIVYRFNPPEIKEGSGQGTTPDDHPRLRLSDGSGLDVIVGRHQPAQNGEIVYALDFAPLPGGARAVTLELPRLAGMPPGSAPENWQIPLQLRPGDPSQIALPGDPR